MKKILVLLFLVLCIASPVFADVTEEVISIDKDANENIRVWTQYKLDGVEVKSKYDKICQDLNKKNEPKTQLDVKKLRQLQRAQAQESPEQPDVKENRKHFLKTLFSMDPAKSNK